MNRRIGALPLAGLRVIDASRVLAGPYLAMMLGDLGADVVKIEQPHSGDPTRAWGPPFVGRGDRRASAYFLAANRNKRSLALDLRHPAGREAFLALVGGADVLVENFLPRDWKALRLGRGNLARRFSGLVQATISGYGSLGPEADRPAYDLVLQAEAGLMAVTGFERGEPVRVGIAIVDMLSATYGCVGVLAALRARDGTQRGARVEVPMADAATAFLSYAAQAFLADGTEAARLGSAHPNLVPYRAFATSDGWLVVAVGSPGQWRRFCTAVEHPDWVDDPRFRDNAARIANRRLLERRVARLVAREPVNAWLDRFRAHRVPAGKVSTLHEAMTSARKRGQILGLPGTPPVETVASAVLFDGARGRSTGRRAPALGEHTDEILREAGYDDDAIRRLRSGGAAQ